MLIRVGIVTEAQLYFTTIGEGLGKAISLFLLQLHNYFSYEQSPSEM